MAETLRFAQAVSSVLPWEAVIVRLIFLSSVKIVYASADFRVTHTGMSLARPSRAAEIYALSPLS